MSVSYTESLIHFWPLGNKLNDEIGGKELLIKLNGVATTDRFGNSDSATLFNKGYGELQPGNYFNSKGYSFLIWVKVLSYNNFQNIIDFGNGKASNNVLIEFKGDTDEMRMLIFSNESSNVSPSSKGVALNEWVHIAATYSKRNIVFYINGIEELTFTASTNDVERTKNFIGNSNWNESYAHAIYDDMKIFNRTLTCDEIKTEKDRVYGDGDEQMFFVLLKNEFFTEGLIHYWPIAGTTKDIIGGNHITIVKNGLLVDDRFGNKKSGDYLQCNLFNPEFGF